MFVFVFTVVLLDTATEPTLEWTRYPYGPQATTPGVSFILNATIYVMSILVNPNPW